MAQQSHSLKHLSYFCIGGDYIVDMIDRFRIGMITNPVMGSLFVHIDY